MKTLLITRIISTHAGNTAILLHGSYTRPDTAYEPPGNWSWEVPIQVTFLDEKAGPKIEQASDIARCEHEKYVEMFLRWNSEQH
ncbi:MAG TPA: hypothetical protein VK673_21910 [Chthoniobacterales bacterium]|nr:hypothetical protein [Chthoniobacterales bacterium]